MPIYFTTPPVVTLQTATVGTVTTVPSVIAPGITLLAANAARLGATIMNDSTKTLFVLCAPGIPSAVNNSFSVSPGMLIDVPDKYVGIISGVWQSVNGNARVTEFTP